MKHRFLALIELIALTLTAVTCIAQQTARVVKYHANDIVAIRAKLRYTTMIQLPAIERILQVATGDKDFWIIDAVGSYCFLHPAKENIHSNLNLITGSGNVYSFTLDEVHDESPDLKVVIESSDASSLASANGPVRLVPASEVITAQAQIMTAQARAAQAIEQFRSDYPTKSLKFDYRYRVKKPFDISAIYHDGQFTYIKSSATEKFSVYELKDGKSNLVSFQLKDGTYVVPKVVDHGYLEIGKHRLAFERIEQ